jgi:hypothetical protein
LNYEHLERRVLGAVSFRDATTNLRIRRPLKVEAAPGVKLVRNRSGSYVIFTAPGFEAYEDSFDQQPVAPDPQAVEAETVAVELKVFDPSREYLPRRSTVRLPLDPATARPAQGRWLFDPIEVKLFPAPTANAVPGWAIIRATVREDGKQDRLPWALITVRRDGKPEALATGLADHRGEAFVAVPGIPVTSADEGPGSVLTSEIPVSLEVIFDTSVPKVRDPEDMVATPAAPGDFVPDPAVLETGAAPQFRSSKRADTLASGKVYRMELTVNLS